MELIDPGEFQMGATRLQGVWREEEFAHPVRISRTILVGSFEITQKEYLQVTNSNPSWFHRNGQGTAKVGDVDTSRFPVEQVSWFDAIEFCNRLSKAEGYEHYYQINEVDRDNGSIRRARVTVAGGNGFRLLIEAEWEYACRATTTTHYHFGTVREGDEANMKSMFSTGYGGPTKTVELGRTTAVGRYKPNLWGLHDMHGNVGEWCWDWYASDYYVKSPKVDPFGPDEGTHRSVRGGSWLVSQSSCRSSSRYFQSPGDRSYQIGFRVARTP
jgi:formylglycine-generating enzyme required for sulfatase activity